MKTILIADDRASGRELLREVLEGCGHRVVEASDGNQALQKAWTHRPDLIVLDLHMPGVDGFAAIQVLRADEAFADVPIIALSASAMPEDHKSVIAAGFDMFLTKPVGLCALRSAVESLLSSPEPEQVTYAFAG